MLEIAGLEFCLHFRQSQKKLSVTVRFYCWRRASTALNQIFIKRIMTFSKKDSALTVFSPFWHVLGLLRGFGCDVIYSWIAGYGKRSSFNSFGDEMVLASQYNSINNAWLVTASRQSGLDEEETAYFEGKIDGLDSAFRRKDISSQERNDSGCIIRNEQSIRMASTQANNLRIEDFYHCVLLLWVSIQKMKNLSQCKAVRLQGNTIEGIRMWQHAYKKVEQCI